MLSGTVLAFGWAAFLLTLFFIFVIVFIVKLVSKKPCKDAGINVLFLVLIFAIFASTNLNFNGQVYESQESVIRHFSKPTNKGEQTWNI